MVVLKTRGKMNWMVSKGLKRESQKESWVMVVCRCVDVSEQHLKGPGH